MDPIYTSANCQPAYELRWSLSLFPDAELPQPAIWLESLQIAVERDGIRILEHRTTGQKVEQFFLTTRPDVAPPAIVKSVKGRLQHLLRPVAPNAFSRNFSLTSVGESRRHVVESYVENQLGHHRMADPRVQERLQRFQFSFPDVNLAEPEFSSHGRYLYNLHLVLVHDRRWCEVNEQRLQTTHDMIRKVATKKQQRLSRLALLTDHLHLTLRASYADSPADTALAYLNNLAYAHRMQPLYQYGYFVGTFGEYDADAIRRAL